MVLPLFVFLLVVCLLLSLALLWSLDWLPLRPSSPRGGAKRGMLHRLLKPRSPDDCPACRLASAPSLGGGPAPLPIRPWSEVKSRRGAPKRIPTAGFACPNQQCTYFGITNAHVHALLRRWQA
jgi:hypothetical protein